MSKPDPKSVVIPDLSQDQLNRLLAADYLESMANLIRKGTVSGFDFAWDQRFEKPVGKVIMSSLQFVAPLEAKLLEQMREAEAEEANKIQVEDLSEDLKNHKCDDEDCQVCNSPHKA